MVMYIPEKGDIVWIEMNPQAGHEQAGKRPAIVLSPKAYNEKVGLALFCPITTQIKGYPFEVIIPKGYRISGAILSDQIKSLDWKARKVSFACKIDTAFIQEAVAKLNSLLG